VQRQIVGHAVVVRFLHAKGTGAQAEVAGVIPLQLRFDGGKVVKIRVDQFPELGVLHVQRAAVDDQHPGDRRVSQAFEQYAFADHAGGPGNYCLDFLHWVRLGVR